MESPQSVVSPFKSSVLSKDIEVNGKEAVMSNVEENFIGVLEVFIHQARDIHNICIYHKQDVYAKICLTSNPDNTASTKIINGGGRNPVFNDNLSLNVTTVESSLKCEIWMLSRVRNYLEDQLLGFALVPLSEVLAKNGGTLEKEFTLSSTDLFHSPAGFVHMSLAYTGASPDVMVVPAEVTEKNSDNCQSLAKDLEKIEFPDPNIAKEDHLMVSEYFGIPCEEGFTTSSDATESHGSEEAGVQLVESFSACSVESAQPKKIVDSPNSSVSTTGVSSPPPSVPARSDSSSELEQVSGTKEKETVDVKDGESDSSNAVPNDTFTKPVVTVNIEPEPKLVQQDIVDLFMKSMQESMAKMKLPNLDVESGPTSSGNSSSEPNSGNRVFYGSRAFF